MYKEPIGKGRDDSCIRLIQFRNMDRTRANPNLLYQAESERLVIIDHNLAFDKDFNQKQDISTIN